MLLVTGATGFLGSETIIALGNRKIRCLVRSHAKTPKGCEPIIGDINDIPAVERAVDGMDTIVHGAAIINGSRDEYQKVNIEGTRSIVEAAKKARVKHFIFISSILAAYEKTTDYGKSKLEGEKIVRESGLPHTILRLSLVYKKNDDKTIGRLIRLVKKLPIIPIARGSFQPAYIEDVAMAIAASADKAPKNLTYNLVGPPITLKEAVLAIKRRLKVRRILLPIPKPMMKLGLMMTGMVAKTFSKEQFGFLTEARTFEWEEAARELNFRPKSLEEGLSKALD